nr:hypothetical protein [Tanacetum cinerariifolium]
QAKGQKGTDTDTLDEDQVGSDPDETFEGQARPDPANAGNEERSISSHMAHAGSDRERMDLDGSEISPHPFTSPQPFTLPQPSRKPVSLKVHKQFKSTTTDTTTTTTTTVPPPQAQQQSTAEAMMVKCIDELEHILADLIQVNKNMEERLDKHRACLHTLEQLDIVVWCGPR